MLRGEENQIIAPISEKNINKLCDKKEKIKNDLILYRNAPHKYRSQSW